MENTNNTDFDQLPEDVKEAIKGFWSYPIGPFECPTGIDKEIWEKYTYGSGESGVVPPQPVDDDIHFIVKKEE